MELNVNDSRMTLEEVSTKQYMKRIENERRSIKALKDGIYFPSTHILKVEKCPKKQY